MTFSSFAKFLWPLATATAQSLGPVPPSPFCIAAFFATQQACSCMQPAVEQREVVANAWQLPAWCAWPYALALARYPTIYLGALSDTILKRAVYVQVQHALAGSL